MRFEARAWQLGNLMILTVVVLSARLVYWAVVRADDLRPVAVSLTAADAYLKALQAERRDTAEALQVLRGDSAFDQLPQPVIQRTMDLLNAITRGTILDRNGRKLAFDQLAADGSRTRVYTEPSLAHVIGYVSGIRAGITGLELTYNDSLFGLDRFDARVKQTLHEEIRGSDLVLTIDSGLQRAATEILAGRAGAAVILDGATGAVLAMANQPGFDPNQVLDPAYTQALIDACAGPECQGALVNRATQGQYTPGSTFKTVTLIAGLDSGQVTPATVFDFGKMVSGPDGSYYEYRVEGGVIPDPNHKEAQLNLEMSYAKSANAAFARMGDEMPAGVLIDYAGRFGFGRPPDQAWTLDFSLATPQLAADVNRLADDALLRASTAIGQGELLVNPMTMALVVMAAVNHGDLPLPYLVDVVRDPAGQAVANQPGRGVVRGLMKPETADLVYRMMITVAEQGSGKPARVEGLTVGGKTGTAQVGAGIAPHSWFIGFAHSDDRGVVIAIVVENAGEGHDVAAPIFARLADAAMRHLGEPVAEVVTGTDGGAGLPPPTANVPLPDVLREPGKLEVVGGPGACPGPYDGPHGSGVFAWPVDPQYRRLVGDDFKPQHPGIDLGAPTGAAVRAADAGVVVFSNWTDLGYGNTVVIDHGNGYQTLYGHLSQLEADCGAKLEAGALVGLAGATGRVFGPHLHFEMRVPEGFLNPWQHLPPP